MNMISLFLFELCISPMQAFYSEGFNFFHCTQNVNDNVYVFVSATPMTMYMCLFQQQFGICHRTSGRQSCKLPRES